MTNTSDTSAGCGPPGGIERRRYPRVPPTEDLKLAVPVLLDTEVLDISHCGALLSTSGVVEPGERAQLRLVLDGEPFNTWVHVVRVHSGTMDGTGTRQRVGVSFVTLDGGSRRTLQRFIRDDTRGS